MSSMAAVRTDTAGNAKMQNRDRTLKSLEKKEKAIILGFFAVTVIYQLLMREYAGDALNYYSHFLDGSSLKEVIAGRYAQWSSRVLIDIIITLLSHNMHMILFGFLNVSFVILLYLSTLRLMHYRHIELTTLLFLTYPVVYMGTAGWMATFINYLWPLASAVFSLLALQSMYEKKKMAISTGTFFILAEIFACDFETLAVFYAVILVWFTIAMAVQKKFTGKRVAYTSVMYAVCTISIVIAAVCPGNKARVLSNTTTAMKYFPSLSFADKAASGINATFSTLTDRSMLYLIFSLMLFIMTLSRKEKPAWLLYVSGIPFTAGVVRTVLKPLISACLPEYSDFFDDMDNFRVDAMNFDRPASYLPLIFYMVIFASIVILYLYSSDDVMTSFEYIAVFTGGMLTRIAMGFSPTLYYSTERTFIFLDMTFIWLTVKGYDSCHEEISSNEKMHSVAKLIYPLFIIIMIIRNIIAITMLSQ